MNKTFIKAIGKSINAISYIRPPYAAKLAITLFATPRKGKLTQTESAFLQTAKQSNITHNNITIKTYQWHANDSYDTILLVHGWESNTYRWKALIAILQTKPYNIVALDAPAHGGSGSKTFNAVLYSECINKVAKQFNTTHIIGHSIGGTASALAVNQYSLPIKKLILLGAPSNFNAIIASYIKTLGYNNRVSKAMDKYYYKTFGRLPDFYTIENFSENINAKGLIIHDKKDRIISFKDALTINKYYKNSTLIKTEGFGHGLKSEKVYSHIIAFLAE
ncbi:MAG: alpha/beta hydrolase [Flavobacteriaceae bacterium]